MCLFVAEKENVRVGPSILILTLNLLPHHNHHQGINTDPSYSNGHLCSCRIEKREGRKDDFGGYVHRLRVRFFINCGVWGVFV